ncbi:MAG: hypothetical protein QOD28_2764 [Acidobacteriota bacterium]|nr:hypothetical protein [Acidobacteriota bacterium]
MRIFYSWQRDLPNKTNRGFIQQALETAAKIVREDDSIEVEPSIDRDTEGVPGAPDITATIFKKIDAADVFVADISIIEKNRKRPIPNPNVLIELGYALKALGTEKIILVLNEAFGSEGELPFDLRQKRIIKYVSNEEDAVRSQERSRLTGIFVKAITEVNSHAQLKASPQPQTPVPPHPAEQIDRLVEFNARRSQYRHTELGYQKAQEEFLSLHNKLVEKVNEYNERSKHIEIECELGIDKRQSVIHFRSLNLVTRLSKPPFANELEGTVLFCGLEESGNIFKAPKELSGLAYLPEIDVVKGIGWKEERAGKSFLTTSDMADWWFERFIKELLNRI